MTISNAIPVQFWINGVETYNETTICGVEDVCFCQPFNCDDEIRIQFTDTSANSYNLQVLDSSGNELELIAFDDVASNVWQVTFISENYGICDEKIQLKIITAAPSLQTLGDWTNQGSGIAWTGTTNPTVTLTSSDLNSRRRIGTFSGVAGQNYIFTVDIDISVSFEATVSIGFLKSDFTDATGTGYSFDSSYSGQITISPSSACSYVYVIVQNTAITVSVVTDIDTFTFSGGSNYTHAQSDCIDIKTSHDCTTLITYINTDDFNGIEYDTSPASEFNLRIPAQFWKEDNPMEQEDSKLSNGVIKTRRQTISEKRLLEIGYLPNYMHKKIQLVLMHDTITIDGDQWKRRDAYESTPINRYPLKRANVWMTKYNSIEDNIL